MGGKPIKAKLQELEELSPGILEHEQQLLAAVRRREQALPEERSRLGYFTQLLTVCSGQNSSHDTLIRHLFNCLCSCKEYAEKLALRAQSVFEKNQSIFEEFEAAYECLRRSELSEGYEARCLADLYYDE